MMLERVVARPIAARPGEYAEVDEPGDLEAATNVIDRFRSSWDAPAGTTVA
jgi:hypothetical protein